MAATTHGPTLFDLRVMSPTSYQTVELRPQGSEENAQGLEKGFGSPYLDNW